MIWAGRSGGLVEDSLTLDLAQLMRLGPMRDGLAGDGFLEWRQDGEAIGSARFRLDLTEAEAARLVLAFCVAVDGKRRTVSQSIRLAFTVPQFGGRRWWMLCPVTGERVRCLYLPPGGDRFASREAWGLSYRMERLGQFDRPFEQLARRQRRLGGIAGWGIVPARPKGMWGRTYARHLGRLAALDAGCGAAILGLMGVVRGVSR
jgi:hypothetical protein